MRHEARLDGPEEDDRRPINWIVGALREENVSIRLENVSDRMDLERSLRIARTRWRLIAACVVLVVGSAAAFSLTQQRQVTNVLVVSRLGSTTRDDVAHLRHRLMAVGARVVGVVANRVQDGRASYYPRDAPRAEPPSRPEPSSTSSRTQPSEPTSVSGPTSRPVPGGKSRVARVWIGTERHDRLSSLRVSGAS